jgi:hypothetical protein
MHHNPSAHTRSQLRSGSESTGNPSPRPGNDSAGRPGLSRAARVLPALTVLLVLLAGTSPAPAEGDRDGSNRRPKPASHDDIRREIGRALDRAQGHVDEYGTLMIGAPILNFARSNEFRFRLNRGASNYFTDAKTDTQGRAARAEQSLNVFGLDASASADITQIDAAKSALAGFRQQLSSWQGAEDARRTAANLRLQAALADAATNTVAGASNRAVAAAWADYATNLYSGTVPPNHPGAGSTNALPDTGAGKLPVGLTDTNIARLIALQPFMALLTNGSSGLTVPNRTALITAAGDHTVEKIFEAITDTPDPNDPYNPVKVFGMTTVSVQPGWRTSHGWAGEVTLYAELEFRKARQETVRRLIEHAPWPPKVKARVALAYGYDLELLKDAGVDPAAAESLATDLAVLPRPSIQSSKNAQPTEADLEQARSEFRTSIPPRFRLTATNKPVQIMVISPLTEVETFDLSSSYRRQSEFALSLSFALRYAGAEGEARAFEKFAHSLQHDIATRTTLGAVNAFSGQEGMFGFQIGPRVRALEDPSRRGSEAGSVLERQTFPALILLTFGKGDATPRLNLDDQGQLRVYEPYLILRQFRRWQPLSRAFLSGRDWYRPGDWFHPRLRESERVDTAALLEAIRQQVAALHWSGKPAPGWTNDPTAALLQRVDFYEQQLVGSVDHLTIPEELVIPTRERPLPPATVDFDRGVVPPVVTLARSPTGQAVPTSALLTFHGTGLDALDPSSIASLSTNATARLAAIHGPELTVFAEIRDASHPVAFSLRTQPKKHLPNTVLTPAVEVELEPDQGLPTFAQISPASVTLARQPADPKKPEPKTVDLILLGTRLDRIDTNQVTVATGDADQVTPRFWSANGGVLQIRIKSAAGPIALAMPLRDGSGAVLSLPVTVTSPEPTSANQGGDKTGDKAAQTLRLDQQTSAAGAAASLSVTVDAKANPETLGTAAKVIVAQIEKDKPLPPAPAPDDARDPKKP